MAAESGVADISVVICAYADHRWDDLRAAIESAQSQTLAPREIVVVIDHNATLLQRLCEACSGVIAAENHESRGLSGARNTGVALARGEVIAFLDDDAIAAPDWLEQLAAGYASRNVLGTGGTIEPNWAEHRPAWFPAEFDWVVGCTYRGMPVQSAPVRNLIGANMSFRRSVFEAIDGFRNDMGRVGTLPVGCEETEFCIRALQRWPRSILLYEPAACVSHRIPASRARWSYFLSRCYAEGRSKAQVARFVGPSDGLASERAYTLRTLPHGVAQGVGDALFRRDLAGLARASAIVLGLITTAAGYLSGAWAGRRAPAAPLFRERNLQGLDS